MCSQVPNYLSVSKRVDLMGIEGRMGESGYIWAKFIRDMAIIVNNALVVFEVSEIFNRLYKNQSISKWINLI